MLADLMNLHNVGVLEACYHLGLRAKARCCFRSGMVAGPNHLPGDHSVELSLAGPVDHAHATAAQHTEQLVAWNGRPLSGGLLGRAAPRHGRGYRPASWRRARAQGAVYLEVQPELA